MDKRRLHIVAKHYLYGSRKLNIFLTLLRCSASFLVYNMYRFILISNPSCQ